MRKYFLAIIPDEPLYEKVHQLKLDIKDKFRLKYSLKSPPHITLKMPFVYNEAKEEVLIDKLQGFIDGISPFELAIGEIKTFGSRVIFLNVQPKEELIRLQAGLKSYCRRELKLVDELSDRNYHPHMTVVFKDIKKGEFENILNYVRERAVEGSITVESIYLLKKIAGDWTLCKELNFNSSNSLESITND